MAIFVWRKKNYWSYIINTFKRVLKNHTNSASEHYWVTMCYSAAHRNIFEKKIQLPLKLIHTICNRRGLIVDTSFFVELIIFSRLSLKHFFNPLFKGLIINFELIRFWCLVNAKFYYITLRLYKKMGADHFFWSVESTQCLPVHGRLLCKKLMCL